MVVLASSDRSESSRRQTTLEQLAYLPATLPLFAPIGSRRWTRHGLQLRVAESQADRSTYSRIVRTLHYLGRWPVPPRTKTLAFLSDLAGVKHQPGTAASMVMVALLPAHFPVRQALDVHPCSILSLVRMWRADDLGPAVAPDLAAATLRRVVRGCGRSGLRPLAAEWAARKLDARLTAPPRLLMTYADPAVGHDGATYEAAGAVRLGVGSTGKIAFAWALDPDLKDALRAYGLALNKWT